MSERPEGLKGYQARLLPLLTEVASETAVLREGRTDRRSPGWVRPVAIASAALALAVAVPVLSSDPLQGAIAVERHGEYFHLRVEDATADPDAMTADLQAAGMDASVKVTPVSPSLVGKWISVFENEPEGGDADPRAQMLWDQMYPERAGDVPGIPQTRVLKVPVDYSNPLVLEVGRATEPGETWGRAHASDAPDETRPGGILYCLGLDPAAPEEADRVLRAEGYELQWSYNHRDVPSSDRLDGPPDDKVVVYSELAGNRVLKIATADPDAGSSRAAIERYEESARC